jgi:Rad3-related DNA helicase
VKSLPGRVEELLAPEAEFGRRFAERFATLAAHSRSSDLVAVHAPEAVHRVAATEGSHYEDRPGQRALAAEIAATLERGGVMVAEAPTGIGKSLAYLLPAVLFAKDTGARVVIATCSRSLQDQLFERDLPAVLDSLGVELACVRLKGKQNYVCPHALELEEGEGAEEREVLEALKHWAARDGSGDLDRFAAGDPEAFRRVRARVAADPGACNAATCRRGRECFWLKARREAAGAKLLIVNHALLAISGDVEGLLPEFDALIVDEAHRLEGVLLGQLARVASLHRIEELLRLVGSGRTTARRGGGLAARLKGFALPLFARGDADGERGGRFRDDIESLVARGGEMRDAAAELFALLEPREARHELYGARERYRSSAELLGPHVAVLETVLEHGSAYAHTLRRFALDVTAVAPGPAAEELAAELEQVSARWALMVADLQELGDATRRDWVYWRSSGARGGVELHGAPVEAGPHARRLVFGRCAATVLTSATLSAGGDVGFVAGRLGLGESWGVPYEAVIHPSPFALARQMKAYVYDSGADEASAVAGVVAELHRATGRNTLALFTSHERLRRARQQLLERMPEGVVMMAQDWDGTASVLSDRFRAARGAILLGVQSLWEGVDFPGGALEVLVVAKLPFSVPGEPWVEARGERLRDQGRDPFRDDAVPEAVLRFRQGVGRLIRRADDRGVLVVCDPRLAGASYRGPFLAALAMAPERMRDPRLLAADAARFLLPDVPDVLGKEVS